MKRHNSYAYTYVYVVKSKHDLGMVPALVGAWCSAQRAAAEEVEAGAKQQRGGGG